MYVRGRLCNLLVSDTSIHTLIPDIYELVQSRGWFNDDIAKTFSEEVATRLQGKFNTVETAPRLRLSKMGPVCPCALWHSINTPGAHESLPPWAEIKYTYGHILEALALCLARGAGHEVTGEQDELVVDGIVGHRDCVVDGCIVDVKSTTSIGYQKFKEGTLEKDDPFGYLDQLDAYLVGSLSDPLVRCKDRAYILAIDKQKGHMCLYEHRIRADEIKSRVREYKDIVRLRNPPGCTCVSIPDGKSGNLRLDTRASYSAQKYLCQPQIRAFLYSDGPRYLTRVVRIPDVPELDRDGKIMYN